MIVDLEKPGTPEELVHYGVKGMKWGVRKSYTDRVSKRAARLRRVGEGKGSALDKLRVHGTTSNITLARSAIQRRPGFKGAALIRAEGAEAHVARVQAGEATALDVLRMAGGVNLADVYRGFKNG